MNFPNFDKADFKKLSLYDQNIKIEYTNRLKPKKENIDRYLFNKSKRKINGREV